MTVKSKRRELTYSAPLRRLSPKKKPGPTAKARAKRRRAESPVAKSVMALCMARDGYCRVQAEVLARAVLENPVFLPTPDCDGPSEWAHLGKHKRARTRGLAPELRHTSCGSMMLCRSHHQRYDAGVMPIVYLTQRGADGAVSFLELDT